MEVRRKKSHKGMKLAPSSSSCFITNLPTPILMDILCRLPIKTLKASKCVCKSWLNLSGDPHFPQLHQAKAPTEVFFQLLQDDNTLKLHMGNFDPLDVKLNTLFEIPKLDVKPNNTLNFGDGWGYFKFANSCNGLLCYHSGFLNRFAVVCNPCTGEFITLPAPATSNLCHYGLGFSKNMNKYKLLRVVSRERDFLGKNAVTEICTIEKGCSWNTLGPCPSYIWQVIDSCSRPPSCSYPSYKDPTFLHGTLHWPSCRNNSDIDILTFDFEDDRFGRVPLPPSFAKININNCRVGELLGRLFITEYTNEGMNIWLMKEYGVQDSWTKIYSLPCIVKGEKINEKCIIPVTCMDNGEILLVDDKHKSSVFSYNPDVEGFRCIGSGRGTLRVIAYKPSLVLLKDSMLGYKVHVSALKHKEMPTSSVLPTVSAMMESTIKRIKTIREEVVEKQRKEERAHLHEFEGRVRNEFVKVVEPLRKQIEQLKQHNQRLEERLQDEKAKVKQQIQQSEQLEQQNQQLEERLKNERAKVKQLKEKDNNTSRSRRKSSK